MARKITTEETLQILRESNEEGLVHVSDNMSEGSLTSTICNCCGCCCTFLDTKKRTGLQTFSPSTYVARVDGELCRACGTCEDRCPMEAIAVGDDDVSEVDPKLCIGCGVCTPTCTEDAVDLVHREEIEPAPTVQELVAARYKAPRSRSELRARMVSAAAGDPHEGRQQQGQLRAQAAGLAGCLVVLVGVRALRVGVGDRDAAVPRGAAVPVDQPVAVVVDAVAAGGLGERGGGELEGRGRLVEAELRIRHRLAGSLVVDDAGRLEDVVRPLARVRVGDAHVDPEAAGGVLEGVAGALGDAGRRIVRVVRGVREAGDVGLHRVRDDHRSLGSGHHLPLDVAG